MKFERDENAAEKFSIGINERFYTGPAMTLATCVKKNYWTSPRWFL
jgi:hypothetical protein